MECTVDDGCGEEGVFGVSTVVLLVDGEATHGRLIGQSMYYAEARDVWLHHEARSEEHPSDQRLDVGDIRKLEGSTPGVIEDNQSSFGEDSSGLVVKLKVLIVERVVAGGEEVCFDYSRTIGDSRERGEHTGQLVSEYLSRGICSRLSRMRVICGGSYYGS